MTLTTGQLTVLKADILADPQLAAWAATGYMAQEIAGVYNLVAAPAWYVWRTNVTYNEVMLNGFDWTRVDNLSVGKSRIWDWMFGVNGQIDPSKVNIRTGIDAVWVGTAADLAVRAAVYVHCKREATRGEKLFSAGVGTVVSPATMGYEGMLTYQDVEAALAS